MSYILEALKKSENERQLGEVPHLQKVVQTVEPVKRDYSQPIIVGAVLLMLINLAVVGYWGLWPSLSSEEVDTALSQGRDVVASMQQGVVSSNFASDDQSLMQTAAASAGAMTMVNMPAKPPQAPQQVSAPFYSLPKQVLTALQSDSNQSVGRESGSEKTENIPSYLVNDYGDEVEADRNSLAYVTSSQNRSVDRERGESINYVPDDRASFASGSVYSSPYEWHQLPTHEEVVGELDGQIPETLELSSHLYSSEPRYRSVVLNGRYLKEAHRLNGGIEVVEIVEEGVILSVDDYYFRLFLE